MAMKLYNSLTKQIDVFKPLKSDTVRMYSCGPTVYNIAHIGNMRSFLFADLLQRVLRKVGGWKVKWVMNITNIDDKTIRDSKIGSDAWLPEMGNQSDDPKENLKKLTLFYEREFIDDINKLGISFLDLYKMPRATEHIDIMQKLIVKILHNGYAYKAGGSIYFDVTKYMKDDVYGKLFKIDFDNFKSGTRVDSDDYERENVSDFVIWKAHKEGEPFWDFEIDGVNYPGRPGWHIECSAMEEEILGLPFDIHTGGIDLKFPHHEDEIAQSKAGYGIEPTSVWCHNEFLEVEGEKMSKSLGNFFTIRDLTEKGISPTDIRFSMISVHYRTKSNFTFSGLEASKKARIRIQDYIYDLFEENFGTKEPDISELKNLIFGELANDLHVPKALGILFTFINNNPSNELTRAKRSEMLGFLKELNEIFNVWKFERHQEDEIEIPENIRKLAQDRFDAKKEKNWAEADRLRKEISDAGYNIKDSKEGYEILPI